MNSSYQIIIRVDVICILSVGQFSGVWILCPDVSEHSVFFHLYGWCKQEVPSCLHHLLRWDRQSVPKRRHIKFRRRRITQKERIQHS